MATLSITIDDAAVPRVRAAFDARYPGRTEAGRTLAQWVTDKLKDEIREIVRDTESRLAAEAARAAAVAAADALTL